MGELKKVHDFWAGRLSKIPSPDPVGDNLAEAAGADKLSEYGTLVTIDNLVKAYPAYKHDDIFNLSLGLVYQLMAINKQRDYIQATAQAMRRGGKN